MQLSVGERPYLYMYPHGSGIQTTLYNCPTPIVYTLYDHPIPLTIYLQYNLLFKIPGAFTQWSGNWPIKILTSLSSLYCIKTCLLWNLAALYSHPKDHDFVFAGLVVMAILKTWRGMTASLSIVESCHYEFSTMCKSLVTAGRIVGALLITSTASWTWRKANVHFSYKLAKE